MQTSSTFILANFDQKYFTDDAQAGHIAPVAAYDPVVIAGDTNLPTQSWLFHHTLGRFQDGFDSAARSAFAAASQAA